MNNAIFQSEEDLRQHLADSIRFLEESCNSYDRGFEGEAKRLSATIRILVHDTSQSTSLLTHLKMKDTRFLDTASDNWSDNTMTYSGLVAMQMATGTPPHYIPLLDSAKGKPVEFAAWWNGIIFVDNTKNTITRKELILSVANKDGGTHVDQILDEKYGQLSRCNSLGWNAAQNGKDVGPLRAPENASVRQIAHELLKTLKPDYKNEPHLTGMVVSGIMHSPRIMAPEPPQDDVQRLPLSAPCHCGSRRKYKKCHGRAFRTK
ncbi:MAG: SEC-C domain-containing protein [Patescibacteria group bacterium]|jgi:hypothetical protein